VPLLLLIVVLLALPILVPLSLVQRYRVGTAKRVARGWVITFNLVMLLISTALYVLGALLTALWLPHAVEYAFIGLGVGAALGVLGLILSRWELVPQGLQYTPNRWLVLGLTLVVSARIVYGIWRGWHAWLYRADDTSWLMASGVAGSFAAGGIVLGYYALYWAGIRWRLARHRRRQRQP
jgi:hypothetical protein